MWLNMLAVKSIIFTVVYMVDGMLCDLSSQNKVNTFVLLEMNCKNSLGCAKFPYFVHK